jgi:oligopeptide/dipeptide ABC transporter ATP-binding protein
VTDISSLLSVRNLVVEFTGQSQIRATDGVSFDIVPGETVGLVGESGSGKSVTALSILRLLPPASAVIRQGEILYCGEDLLKMSKRKLRAVRGNDIAMVFQDPTAFLNPTLPIGRQLTEGMRAHDAQITRRRARQRAEELLALVGIPQPSKCLGQYPHEYSGGMRQRVMIAMAIANEPKLLIADEPTTALDVTIQAQVVEVLQRVQAETGAALLLITHDLGLARELVERVLVMYAGRIIEEAPLRTALQNPRHPYTCGLIASLPRLERVLERLPAIPGQTLVRRGDYPGCVFEPRCGLGHGRERCISAIPDFVTVAPGHASACHFTDEVETWRATELGKLDSSEALA